MPDRYGPRGVFALMVPYQNANMQPEYEAMRPEGISNQIYRFSLAVEETVAQAALDAVAMTRGCWPDRVVVGNSVEMRLRTPARLAAYRAELQDRMGDVPVVTASEACPAALRTLGAKRIAALSPMSDAHSDNVRAYYEALGFEVPYHMGLQVGRSEDIIDLGADEALAAFRQLDLDDVDTFLHVGGALGIVDAIEDMERALGRPVVSVNAATYWYALRRHGIIDAIPGFGRLLMEAEIVD